MEKEKGETPSPSLSAEEEAGSSKTVDSIQEEEEEEEEEEINEEGNESTCKNQEIQSSISETLKDNARKRLELLRHESLTQRYPPSSCSSTFSSESFPEKSEPKKHPFQSYPGYPVHDYGSLASLCGRKSSMPATAYISIPRPSSPDRLLEGSDKNTGDLLGSVKEALNTDRKKSSHPDPERHTSMLDTETSTQAKLSGDDVDEKLPDQNVPTLPPRFSDPLFPHGYEVLPEYTASLGPSVKSIRLDQSEHEKLIPQGYQQHFYGHRRSLSSNRGLPATYPQSIANRVSDPGPSWPETRSKVYRGPQNKELGSLLDYLFLVPDVPSPSQSQSGRLHSQAAAYDDVGLQRDQSHKVADHDLHGRSMYQKMGPMIGSGSSKLRGGADMSQRGHTEPVFDHPAVKKTRQHDPAWPYLSEHSLPVDPDPQQTQYSFNKRQRTHRKSDPYRASQSLILAADEGSQMKSFLHYVSKDYAEPKPASNLDPGSPLFGCSTYEPRIMKSAVNQDTVKGAASLFRGEADLLSFSVPPSTSIKDHTDLIFGGFDSKDTGHTGFSSKPSDNKPSCSLSRPPSVSDLTGPKDQPSDLKTVDFTQEEISEGGQESTCKNQEKLRKSKKQRTVKNIKKRFRIMPDLLRSKLWNRPNQYPSITKSHPSGPIIPALVYSSRPPHPLISSVHAATRGNTGDTLGSVKEELNTDRKKSSHPDPERHTSMLDTETSTQAKLSGDDVDEKLPHQNVPTLPPRFSDPLSPPDGFRSLPKYRANPVPPLSPASLGPSVKSIRLDQSEHEKLIPEGYPPCLYGHSSEKDKHRRSMSSNRGLPATYQQSIANRVSDPGPSWPETRSTDKELCDLLDFSSLSSDVPSPSQSQSGRLHSEAAAYDDVGLPREQSHKEADYDPHGRSGSMYQKMGPAIGSGSSQARLVADMSQRGHTEPVFDHPAVKKTRQHDPAWSYLTEHSLPVDPDSQLNQYPFNKRQRTHHKSDPYRAYQSLILAADEGSQMKSFPHSVSKDYAEPKPANTLDPGSPLFGCSTYEPRIMKSAVNQDTVKGEASLFRGEADLLSFSVPPFTSIKDHTDLIFGGYDSRDTGRTGFNSKPSDNKPSRSLSRPPSVPDLTGPEDQLSVLLDLAVSEGIRAQAELSSVRSEAESGYYDDAVEELDERGGFVSAPRYLKKRSYLTVDCDPQHTYVHIQTRRSGTGSSGYQSDAVEEWVPDVIAESCSVTNTLPTYPQIQTCSPGPAWTKGVSGSLPRSHSSPSLSHVTSAENRTLTRACNLPNLKLQSSCEQFTPDIVADEDQETYRFVGSCSGLYQCSVTGLVFHMEQEGEVVYRTVPWDRRLLSKRHKWPAGPLFDIKCEQQSVCQLHLPHCEIRSTGGAQFLRVAHVDEEGMEFIDPHKITKTHVVINISGFSAYGNVKDEDSPPDPVRALVLLFYRPPADPDPSSLLNVLLLPRNVVIPDVARYRKKLIGDERYIETSSYCKLRPQQDYSLSTRPEDDSVLVEPTTAEFESDHYGNYIPSFQVTLENPLKHLKLVLRDSSHSVWERRVDLSSSGVQRSWGQSAPNLKPDQRLYDIRISFIEGVSEPVLKTLLDKLFEKKVMNDSERESVDEMRNRRDKARVVIDTVRKKSEKANSEMINFLCELDPFFSEHLGLM